VESPKVRARCARYDDGRIERSDELRGGAEIHVGWGANGGRGRGCSRGGANLASHNGGAGSLGRRERYHSRVGGARDGCEHDHDDLVEVRRVINAGDPERIGRARVGERYEGGEKH
jgi:hypothetical protein